MDSIDITTSGDGDKPRTMSSREIAELTGKEHRNVARDIRAMLNALNFEPVDFESNYRDMKGELRTSYLLPRRECLILVSGYSVELRARIIDRWEQLERQVAARPDPVAVLNDPAAMRALLLGYTEKVLALESLVEAAKPKTGFYDRFVNADGLYGLQNAARAINCHPNLFVRWLKQEFMFYQGTALVPRVRYLQMGLFEVKSEIVDEKARVRSYITAKGIEYFSSRAPDPIRMKGAA